MVVESDETKIDAIFAGLNQCHLPGAAVGIAIGGKPVYRKGFGLANIELPVVLSPSTRLRLGSTSKIFTCLAYLLLCEEGKAGIDDPIGKHVPELHPVTHRVTMRQLMGNTSGLRDVYSIFTQFNEPYVHSASAAQSTRSADLLELYETIADVNAPPGVVWIYNNGGWLILSAVIERIAAQTLEEVMRERIFEPIGMYDSLLLRSDSVFVPGRAAQHAGNAADGFERLYWGVDNFLGAGAIVSTVDDMLRWMANMDTHRVGSAATWAAIKAPQRLANGHSSRYGLGLFLDRYRGVEMLFHAGGALGGYAQMIKVPQAALDIILLVNRQDVAYHTLATRILDACLPELNVPEECFRGPFVTGVFRSASTGRVLRLFAKDGKQVVSEGADRLFENADEQGVLWDVQSWSDPREGVQAIGNPEQPTAIRYFDFGNVDELQRVPLADGTFAARILGRYHSRSTDTTATITETPTGVQLATIGRFGSMTFELECIAQDIWQARPAGRTKVPSLHGGMVSFDNDGRRFLFSNYSTRGLPFLRCA